MRLIRFSGVAAALVLLAGAAWFNADRPARAQVGSLLPGAIAVTVGTSSTQLLPANGARHGFIIYNQSANILSVLPGTAAAVANAAGTINVAASGGTMKLICSASFPCGNAFQGIASGSSSAITIWEF